MICVKNSFCAFLARVKIYTHTKNLTRTFTGSHLRAVTNADDDDNDNDNVRRHSTTTRVTYRQWQCVADSGSSSNNPRRIMARMWRARCVNFSVRGVTILWEKLPRYTGNECRTTTERRHQSCGRMHGPKAAQIIVGERLSHLIHEQQRLTRRPIRIADDTDDGKRTLLEKWIVGGR